MNAWLIATTFAVYGIFLTWWVYTQYCPMKEDNKRLNINVKMYKDIFNIKTETICLLKEEISMMEHTISLMKTDVEYAHKQFKSNKLEDIEPLVNRLHSWCYAYPDHIFLEVTKKEWKKADALLQAAGISMTGMNASNMRHVVNGVREIANQLNDTLYKD